MTYIQATTVKKGMMGRETTQCTVPDLVLTQFIGSELSMNANSQ